MREIGHFIGGKPVAGTSGKFGDVFNPASGELAARVALAGAEEVNKAVAAAAAAWPAWANTPPLRRARVMFKLKELLERDRKQLGAIITETGMARCCPTPTARCSAAWKWWSSPAAFPIC